MTATEAPLHPFMSGRRGDKLRGDVWYGFTPASSGGIELDFYSRLDGMYGDSTRELLRGLLAEAGIEHGLLSVNDAGAYPFLLRARLESLLIRVTGNQDLRLSPEPPLGAAMSAPRRERARRSRLYLPGNESKYMLNAAVHGPDAVILDLEDSVAPSAKEDARAVIRHALFHLDWQDCERMVRINQGAMGFSDLAYLADTPLHLILVPKVETAEEMHAIDQALGERDVLLMPIIESAKGVMNAMEIASASPRNVALTLGLEDLTADLGVVKTTGGHETSWACSQVIYAAKAHGLQAIDSVYGNVADEEGLRASVQEAKAIGFEGKGCVHPRQIKVIHEEFAPTTAQVERAGKIALAFEKAEKQGLGVVSLGSKMIDPPVVKRALKTVADAIDAGLLALNWRD
ncbi:MAG: citrate lyase ACP [Planctomycetes bacterium]|nr:citrate lyase ACP [Planctomycetota bacterium]